MPRRVQNLGSAEPQIDEIVRRSFDSVTGGDVHGPVTHKAAVLNVASVTNQGAVKNDGTQEFNSDIITDFKIKKATPALRLKGTEGSAKDWRIAEDAGVVKIQENTGSEGAPTWTTRFTIDVNGVASPPFGKTIKTDGDFVTASASMVNVTGLAVTITLTKAARCRVSLISIVDHATAAPQVLVTLGIDSSDVADGTVLASLTGGIRNQCAFTYYTAVLGVGSHTFQVRMSTSSGNGTMYANSTVPAILQVEQTDITS